MLASSFNVVDSFDTHANIPAHFAAVDAAAKAAGKTALISCGWDPGMFSINRVYAGAILPDGADYTFWGRGVSQGHSDAIRRIDGVLDARQYTVPVQAAVDAVRRGEAPQLTARQKHTRECYVVAAEGADRARIEREIKTMKNYFDEYDTTVNFITQAAWGPSSNTASSSPPIRSSRRACSPRAREPSRDSRKRAARAAIRCWISRPRTSRRFPARSFAPICCKKPPNIYETRKSHERERKILLRQLPGMP